MTSGVTGVAAGKPGDHMAAIQIMMLLDYQHFRGDRELQGQWRRAEILFTHDPDTGPLIRLGSPALSPPRPRPRTRLATRFPSRTAGHRSSSCAWISSSSQSVTCTGRPATQAWHSQFYCINFPFNRYAMDCHGRVVSSLR